MNRERAKELLPVITAFAEGKDIQWRKTGEDEEWNRLYVDFAMTFPTDDYDYRIKPEPFECWVNIYGGQDAGTTHSSRKLAESIPALAEGRKTIHMREVE